MLEFFTHSPIRGVHVRFCGQDREQEQEDDRGF